MPYKDLEKQKAAQRRSYQRRKGLIAQRAKEQRVERNQYVRVRRADLLKYVEALKEGKACLDCGGLFPPCAMDFDHVRGDKLYGVRTLITHGYSRTVIDDEIAKCDLVCANCHRIRHYLPSYEKTQL